MNHYDIAAYIWPAYTGDEWTESSYLQPDDRYGYGYLDAVKKVFGHG